MSFRYISFLSSGGPICSAEGNGLCIFGRGHYEEHEISFELRPVV